MTSFVTELRDTLIELHCDQKDWGTSLLQQIRFGRLSEMKAKGYMVTLQPIFNAIRLRPNVLRCPDEAEYYAQGRPDFEIGSLQNDLRFGIRWLDRVRHILLTGMTGSGKTHFMLVLLLGIAAHNQRHPDEAISCIIFQRKGIQFAQLAQMVGWYVASVHHGLRLSVAAPQNFPSHIFNNAVCEMFSHRAGMIASSTCLSQIMAFAEATLNANPGPRLLAPTFGMCLEIVENVPPTVFGGKPEYMAFLRHTLTGLLLASNNLWDAHASLDLEDQIIRPGQSICIDITNVRPSFLRMFIVDLITAQILLPRMHRGACNERRVLVVLDEADEDLMPGAEAGYTASLPPISMILKQGREFRVGCMLGVSHLGNMSQFVRNNATYQVAFTPADHQSLWETAHTLLIPSQDGMKMLKTLPVGQCIAVESLGSYPQPVLVDVDPIQLPEIPVQYQQMPFIPGKTLAELPELKHALDKRTAKYNCARARQEQATQELSGPGHDVLSLAVLNSYLPWARLMEKMNSDISPGQQKTIREQLEQAGFADFGKVRLGQCTKQLIEATEKGQEYLNRPICKRQGRGGIVHRHATHWVAWLGAQRGHKAVIEYAVSAGHHVDVAWLSDNVCEVFEICVECLEVNLVHHALACFVGDHLVTTLTPESVTFQSFYSETSLTGSYAEAGGKSEATHGGFYSG